MPDRDGVEPGSSHSWRAAKMRFLRKNGSTSVTNRSSVTWAGTATITATSGGTTGVSQGQVSVTATINDPIAGLFTATAVITVGP